ncbi:MAG: GHKL domain-containing protein [Gammaproteobacteria bacterium]|nr:GHKL domain-containing protein [Gammaproteobacteria bacterium]
MSPLVVAWSMCASACLMLGLMHLLFWFRDRKVSAYLLSALMGFSAAVSALLELAMLTTESVQLYSELLFWGNFAIFMILVPMVWFVHLYFRTGRRWLAIIITLLWSTGILVNFLLPGNLTFEHITELKRLTAFWGEPFSLPVGELNPWRLLADLASLLILVYTLDATLHLWRRDRSRRAWVVGGSIVIFILLAGIHTPLVDAGVVATPYMISFSFLAIVFALSYQVVVDAVKASSYEQELQQTRRNLDRYARVNLLGECTTMLAHELNQPLTAILSNAQAARRYLAFDKPEMDEVHEILDDIVRDDKRASGIIHGLRNMLQKEDVVRQRFDLNEAAREVTAILDSEFREKGIELTAHYAPALPSLYAGRVEIQQVILNLLVNAARAVQQGGNESRKISLRTRVANAAVQVQVKDSGPGIAAEIHDSLFNTFVSDREDRLGMGLAICQRIIEAYGGSIRVENIESGGALFSFTLPVEL